MIKVNFETKLLPCSVAATLNTNPSLNSLPGALNCPAQTTSWVADWKTLNLDQTALLSGKLPGTIRD